MLLQERGIFGNQTSATAVVIDKNADAKQVKEVMDSCAFLRNNGRVVLVRRIKNFAFQLKQLQEQGCDKIFEFKDGKLNQVNLNK